MPSEESQSRIPQPAQIQRWIENEWPLFAMVLLVMAGDVVTTHVGLSIGIEESNPAVAIAMEQLGIFGLVLMKGVGLASLFCLPALLDEAEAQSVFRIGCIVYAFIGVFVVSSNTAVILG